MQAKQPPQDRILDAAMRVFRRHGFRRSSIEQAAEEAGLTRQALYHHFSSKEVLFRAVIERLYEHSLAAESAAAKAAEEKGRDLADILVAEIAARLRRAVRLARGLAAYRGAVLRASRAGARPLPDLCDPLRGRGRGHDRARHARQKTEARKRRHRARSRALRRDGDPRHQIRLPLDAAARRLPEAARNHAANADRRCHGAAAKKVAPRAKKMPPQARKTAPQAKKSPRKPGVRK